MADEKDILFGQIAVRAGFATEGQIQEALRKQSRDAANGRRRRLGEVLIELGHLTRQQAQSVLRRQQSRTGEHKMVGKYEVLAKLGEGGMGSVYLARDTETQREVALKVLPPKLAENQDYLMRFRREAKSVQALHHPNIAAGLDFGLEDGYHYFAMEYIDGPTLYEMISDRKRLPEREALQLALHIAGALEHAAKREIVHRDIKPENIMLDPTGQAKLVDMGLARSFHDESVRLTQSGMAIGTPHYISPEQARGEHEVDSRSDIYSLGATLYHAITGRVPFDGATAAVIMTKHLNEELPWPSDVNPEVSEAASVLISRMLAKEAQDRYQTPTELVEDIRKVLRGESPSRQLLPVGRSLVSPTKIQAAAQKAERIRRERRKQRLEETGLHKPVARKTEVAATLAGLSDSAIQGAAVAKGWFMRQPAGIRALIGAGAALAFVVIVVLIALPSGRPAEAPPKVGASGAEGATPADPAAAREARATQALREAREYGRLNPGDKQGFGRRLDDICVNYSGTQAATEALNMLVEVARQSQPVAPEPPAGAPEAAEPKVVSKPAPPPATPPPPKETVLDLIGEGLAGWQPYGNWSRAGEAIWFNFHAAKPLRRTLLSGSQFGDLELTGEFRADGSGTVTFGLRDSDDGLLWVDLGKDELAKVGRGWQPFSFLARGKEARFAAGGHEFPVKRDGNPEHGRIRFSRIGGSLGLKGLKAKLIDETPPDRLLLFGSDFEAGKSELWLKGQPVSRTTHRGSRGALSGGPLSRSSSRDISSLAMLSEPGGIFKVGEDMRIRFAVYVKYISYFEVRVFVRDVDGSFVYRPKSLPAEGKWTVIEMRADEFKHERIRGLAIAPGDTIKIVSIAAGKPPLKTKLFIDDFQITVKR